MLALANYSDSDSCDEDNTNALSKDETVKHDDKGASANATAKEQLQSTPSLANTMNVKRDAVPDDDIHCSDEEETPEEMKLRINNAIMLTANRLGVQPDSSSEEQSSSEESDVENEEDSREKTVYEVLDNPFRDTGTFSLGEGRVKRNESVFQIAFREQEDKKAAALERHVKMTEMAGAVQMINGKKMCWNHRKGRCRFGHNCTFAHDTDLPSDDAKRKKT